MWQTNTFWFDVAMVFATFAIGNILLGHFEDHKPKWRRMLKVAIALAVCLWLSYCGLRWVTLGLFLFFAVVAAYIHMVWLPKHGVNGWTGEPRERYLELVKAKSKPNKD